MPAGRPSEYNYELCKEILEQVARGKNVIHVLESDDRYPAWSTFRHWKRDYEELQTLYIKAIQDKATACEAEIQEIQNDLRNKILDPSTANVLIQTLKWKAAKFYPKMFGDKVDVTTGGDKLKNTQQFMVIPESIANQLNQDVHHGSKEDSGTPQQD